MTESPPLRRRARHLLTAGFLAVVLLGGAACTPQETIYVVFGGPDGQDNQLVHEANVIAECESKFDPGAVSPTDDHGVFQINAVHREQFEQVTGQPWSEVYDPYWNAVYAKWLHDREGWGPWACRRAL